VADFTIRPMDRQDHPAAARIMAGSDPWLTLGIDEARALATMEAQGIPGVVATLDNGTMLGFIRYEPKGFIGYAAYIRTVAVAPQARGKRVGETLMNHVESLVFEQAPLLFLFCSTFNVRGQAFYERLGYERVGTVDAMLVPQHGEVLLVKRRKVAAP